MKQHIPAPARGRSRLMSYCGIEYDSPTAAPATRAAAVLAAHGGELAGYCRRCVAQALASAFRQMEYGAEGARMSQAGRSVEVRRELGRRAAEARWSRWRALRATLAAEPMRLGVAVETEQAAVVRVEGAPPKASGA